MRELLQVWEAIKDLRRRVSQKPNVILSPPLPYMFVNIVSGNTLDSGQLGVKYSSSEIATVPSAYDPTVTSSFIDGIGRGTLYINGTAQASYVLVVNDTRGVNRNAVIIGENPYTGGSVEIPVSGGGGTTVRAYVVC